METTRKAVMGVAFPRARVRVTSDIPIGIDEVPVVICLRPGDVQVIACDEAGFVVENTTTKLAPYAALVVPKRLATLASLPWREAVAQVVAEYREGVFNEMFLKLFEKYAARRTS